MEQCETEGCSGVVFKQHLCLVCANKLFDTATSSDASKHKRVLLSPRQNADKIDELRRAIDNIKVRAYELGQKELHDMALAALEKA